MRVTGRVTADRARLCPFLLRVFVRAGAHNPSEAYGAETQPTEGALELYTWRDATLREVVEEVKLAHPVSADSSLQIALVFPNSQVRCRERGCCCKLGADMGWPGKRGRLCVWGAAAPLRMRLAERALRLHTGCTCFTVGEF